MSLSCTANYSPESLYNLSINAATAHYQRLKLLKFTRDDILLLPSCVLLDFYTRLYDNDQLCLITRDLSTLPIFYKLLHAKRKRDCLIIYYQTILNHEHSESISKKLLNSYTKLIDDENDKSGNLDLIDMGLRIGTFLCEGGWYAYSLNFVKKAEELLLSKKQNRAVQLHLLECYRLKLHVQSLYCCFDKAHDTYLSLTQIIDELETNGDLSAIFASPYCTLSMYFFTKSCFDESFHWALKAFTLLPQGLTKKTVLDILRQFSKVCVVKRRFAQAGLLIKQAMNLGIHKMGNENHHPGYSDLLMDYGFYLLNTDAVIESTDAYMAALNHKIRIFEDNNIQIALAHEDLAYSLYVSEYSSGNFAQAQDHAEKAISIMTNILPHNHLRLASAKRVNALILEEIALDYSMSSEDKRKELLSIAERLHLSALDLSKKIFGENNVQTAKHYGNLGRLYQSMNEFEKAETMHQKAIKIKEEILGPYDYEVGLSVGHLASLYNYHMNKRSAAEKLYLRSVEINLRLFGPAYSGLEYDYRGLLHLYSGVVNTEKYLFYSSKYREWRDLRRDLSLVDFNEELLEPRDIVQRFFEIGDQQIETERQRILLADDFKRAATSPDNYSVANSCRLVR